MAVCRGSSGELVLAGSPGARGKAEEPQGAHWHWKSRSDVWAGVPAGPRALGVGVGEESLTGALLIVNGGHRLGAVGGQVRMTWLGAGAERKETSRFGARSKSRHL